MSLSSVELWHRIAANQLASPMQCRAWAADASAGLSPSEAMDGARIARQLIEQGKLTQFQADTLLSGSDQPLSLHGWRLLEPVNFNAYGPPDVRCVWNDWWVAAKSATSAPLWVRWLSADELRHPSLSQAHPSLPMALRHSQIDDDQLQAVLPPEMAEGTLQMCVAPLNGKLLTSFCDGTPVAADKLLTFLMDVAAGLSVLHAAGSAHGRVIPDRICMDETGRYRLLRDPLCWSTMPLPAPGADGRGPLGLLASKLPTKLLAAHFMAPEFLSPAQQSTPQTDCYSLGCTAWLLLTGKPPFAGHKPEKILAAHAEQKLDMTAVANVPEPVMLCLLHCLAKNPTARFADASQLLESLQEARRIVNTPGSAAPTPARAPVQTSPPIDVALTDIQPRSEPVQAVAVTSHSTLQPSRAPNPAAPQPATPQPATPQPATPQPAIPQPAVPQPTSKASLTKASASQLDQLKTAPKATPTPNPIPAQKPAPVAEELLPSGSAVSAVSGEVALTGRAVEARPVATVNSTVAPGSAATPASTGVSSSSEVTEVTAASPVVRSVAPGVRSRSGPRVGARRPLPKRKSKNAWLTPLIGGGALVVLLLVVLVTSGVPMFRSAGSGAKNNTGAATNDNNNSAVTKNTSSAETGATTTANNTNTAPADPRAALFELVTSDTNALWAPPRKPEPIPIDLLPPGAQAFFAMRPERLFERATNKQLLSLLEPELAPVWQWLRDESGVSVEELAQIVIGAYPGQSGAPQYAVRVQLKNPQPLSKMKAVWQSETQTKVGEQVVFVSGQRAFYLTAQPLVDSQSVTEFVVGPTELIREAAELQGAAGPLGSQLEQLWQATDRAAEVCILLNPSFVFTEGRQWLQRTPVRVAEQLQKWLARDMRGAMFSTSFDDEWYFELRLAGASDRDAGANQQKLSDTLQSLPEAMESWLVNQSPHQHWRAMAMRFPNMLRALATQTRVGTENGQAIANAYLPIAAAPNLIYASWMAMQPTATAYDFAVKPSGEVTNATQPLTPAQILDRPISIAVDVQDIEGVLKLIGEQANEKLPTGTKSIRFELDGAAFQRSGITRNQPIRDFKFQAQPVRVVLTELVKRGNPVPGIEDLRTDEQKLIWIVASTPDQTGETTLFLTSREAATAAKRELPAEFAPPKS